MTADVIDLTEGLLDKLNWNQLTVHDLSILEDNKLNNSDYAMNWVDLFFEKKVLQKYGYLKEEYDAEMIFVGRNGASYFLDRTLKTPIGIVITRDNWGKKSEQDTNTRDYIFAEWSSAKSIFVLGDNELNVSMMNNFLEGLNKKGGPIGSFESGVSFFTLTAGKSLSHFAESKNELIL